MTWKYPECRESNKHNFGFILSYNYIYLQIPKPSVQMSTSRLWRAADLLFKGLTFFTQENHYPVYQQEVLFSWRSQQSLSPPKHCKNKQQMFKIPLTLHFERDHSTCSRRTALNSKLQRVWTSEHQPPDDTSASWFFAEASKCLLGRLKRPPTSCIPSSLSPWRQIGWTELGEAVGRGREDSMPTGS